MKRYLITGNSSTATLTYGSDGYLTGVEIHENTADELAKSIALKTFLAWIPLHQNTLKEQWIDNPHPKLKVSEIAPDLSFATFWEKFDHKVGNRNRAQAIWEKLDLETRNTCMLKIRQYKAWIKANPGIAHLYAETFLSQRRWENEFKIN